MENKINQYTNRPQQKTGLKIQVAVKRGCLNQQCFCTGRCQEIIGWRDKLLNEN